jgi:hypothetical protein
MLLAGYFPESETEQLQVIATTFNAGVLWQLKLLSLIFKDATVMKSVIINMSNFRRQRKDV